MKFGKQLRLSVVLRWSHKYVPYKLLKQRLKRVLRARDGGAGTDASTAGAGTAEVLDGDDDAAGLGPLRSYDEERAAFFAALERSLAALNVFVTAKLKELQAAADGAAAPAYDSSFVGEAKPGDTSVAAASSSVDGAGILASEPDAAAQDNAQLYKEASDLRSFISVNATAIGKIVKKYDKRTGEAHRDEWQGRVAGAPFNQEREAERVAAALRMALDVPIEHAFSVSLEDSHDHVGLLRGGDSGRRGASGSHAGAPSGPGSADATAGAGGKKATRLYKPVPLLVAFVLAALVLIIPMFDAEHARAHRCLGIVTFITVLWVTEALPFFVSALSIPPLAVMLQVLSEEEPQVGPDGCRWGNCTIVFAEEAMTAPKAAHLALTSMFDPVLMLLIGGFALSSAMSQCQLELRLARYAQQRYGSRPQIFILAIMVLAMFMSMWISNVTAPVLVVSVIHTTLLDLPRDSRFVKALLICIAFACNIGGMLAPVSSPQNAVSLEALEEEGLTIPFAQWMGVAVPFGCIGLVACWKYLMWQLDPTDVRKIPNISRARALEFKEYFVMGVGVVACLLWSTLSLTASALGNLGVIGLLVAVVLFGTGILTKKDLAHFPWHLLFLIAGGNVLGLAVHSSGLLHIVSDAFTPLLTGSLWWVNFKVLMLVTFVTTFVSHTVAAIILMPLITTLGEHHGSPQLVVMSAALACSGSMSLPMTSFPNVNSLLAEDAHGRPFLTVMDFIRVGVPMSAFMLVANVTYGYLLMMLVFET